MKPEQYKARMDLIWEFQKQTKAMQDGLEHTFRIDWCNLDKHWAFMDKLIYNLAEDISYTSKLKLNWTLEELIYIIHDAEFCTRTLLNGELDTFGQTEDGTEYSWDLTLWNSWLSMIGIAAQGIEENRDTHSKPKWKIGE